MTLAAEVVQRWLAIVEQQQLRAILTEQLETNKTYLELVELRFRKSLVSALDVYQQRQTVSDVQKQIPLVEAQEQVLRHELAVLLGRPPTATLTLGSYDLESVPAFPLTGVPAELLLNRPDVRAALARLKAADHRVAAARADRLPAIRLSGGIGYSADDIANVFDDWFLNLAGGLTGPLFDGRRREAEAERTLAVVEERLADYRLTVLTAIREVEDAIVQERKQAEYIDALARQLADARNALREASQRYRKALNDYLPVLAALERTQQLTRSLVTARRDLLTFRVNLYRALGGTWTEQLEPAPRLSDESVAAKAVNG
jgi:NodT family efflux transporter outer membrane factor (OMF) lipoprotein